MTSQKDNNLKIKFIYKSFSNEGNFKLSKALSMLLNEQDILNYFQKLTKKSGQKYEKSTPQKN